MSCKIFTLVTLFSFLMNSDHVCFKSKNLMFVMLKKLKPSLKGLKMKSFRRTKRISSLIFALIIQYFLVPLKVIIFKLPRLRFNLFNITDLLCDLSCLLSSVAKETATVSFISLIKSLEFFSDASLA